MKLKQEKGELTIGGGIFLGILCILAIVMLATMFTTIPAGHRGVHLRFNKVIGTYNEGLNVKAPFGIDKVVKMSVQTQLYEEPGTMAASRDLQDVTTSVAINYKIDPAFVGEIYRTLGTEYITRIAKPAVQEIVKQVTAKYDAEDMIIKRESVKNDITKSLKDRLAERGIIAETVNITNFQFSTEFTKAIESKVVAQQAVLEAENKLKRIEVEARQAEAKAVGDANAAIERARGQAEAASILSAALVENPEYLQYVYIDKLAGEAQIIIVPEGMPMTFSGK